MAFLTRADITNDLPSGFDTAQVDRLLLSAEAELKRIGLVFEDEATSAFTIEVDIIPRSIFNITPTRSIESVNIKYNGADSSTQLVSGADYKAFGHPNIASYTVQLELLNREISGNEYLEIVGKRGIYIDFNSSSYESKLLTAAITDWVRSQLNIKKGQLITEQGITEAGTGESKVSFGTRTQTSKLSNQKLVEYEGFMAAYDWLMGV